ncbi:MAG: ISKra4 family transposase [Candidatus Binatia bacterium]
MERAARAKQVDLEAWENALRAAVLSAGAKALAGLLEGLGCGRRDEAVVCDCGARMESRGLRSKPLLTILGSVDYQRSLFQCPACEQTRYPGDEELDVVETTRSPGLRRMMARAGSQSTFKQGRDDLKVYAGIELSAKDVERVAERIGGDMERWSEGQRQALFEQGVTVRTGETIPLLYISYDGTGVPMIPSALQGRPGKQPDGTAKTREMKLGCVFTQTTTDSKGFPIRDPESTSFVAAIETAEWFGQRIYAEAVRRGLHGAERVVVLGDAAPWVKNLAELHFPEATLIVDLYHARQHVSDLCKILFAPDDDEVVQYRMRWWTALDEGRVEQIAEEALERLPDHPKKNEEAEKEIAYLIKNKDRMRYADFRAQGLFVGSGVVEAGCKTIIGSRLKQSGMEWSVRGANAIVSLRCMLQSGRFEDYWESRTA